MVQGDITTLNVDAVVNAANSSLLGGGGVDGAIHRAGGPAILEACKEIRRTTFRNGLPTGQAVMTTAGNLPARFVIHTVGPIWQGGHARETELLAEAYTNCLSLAREKGLRTIAFPAISTGVYGFPIEKASVIALNATKAFLHQYPDALDEVLFVLFSRPDFEVYEHALTGIEQGS